MAQVSLISSTTASTQAYFCCRSTTGWSGFMCHAHDHQSYDEHGPQHSHSSQCACRALDVVMDTLPLDIRSNITSLAVDGTSATALLVDRDSREFLATPLMYYMAQGPEYVEAVRVSSPPSVCHVGGHWNQSNFTVHIRMQLACGSISQSYEPLQVTGHLLASASLTLHGKHVTLLR